MLAFDVVCADGRKPDGPAAKSLTARALAARLVVLTCGTHDETVRMLPPLTIPDRDLKEVATLLARAIRQTP
jgi:4-aminobutyrate aminotransferase/(S)-3-amino-2-methylpropionate transaminase